MAGMLKGGPSPSYSRVRILIKCLGGELSLILWSNLWWRSVVLIFLFWRMPVTGSVSNWCAVAATDWHTKTTLFGQIRLAKAHFLVNFGNPLHPQNEIDQEWWSEKCFRKFWKSFRVQSIEIYRFPGTSNSSTQYFKIDSLKNDIKTPAISPNIIEISLIN